MQLKEFAESHGPALEYDEARHNLMLWLIGRAAQEPDTRLRFWSLGAPGACAVQDPGRPLILGDVDDAQCGRLAGMVRGCDVPGVVGSGDAPARFAACARDFGAEFAEYIPLCILKIETAPRRHGVPGQMRAVTSDDADLFADWRLAFAAEATPHDPPVQREALRKAVARGEHFLWVVEGVPVSIATIARRTRSGAAINGVYTPPNQRNRGYAGAVTAALVDRIRATGKSFACLYVDRRNPASNRCYAKIGFTPLCEAGHYVRMRTDVAPA